MKTRFITYIQRFAILVFFVTALHTPSGFAAFVPYEEWLPSDTFFVLSGDYATVPKQVFPNYNQALSQWYKSLNDIFEYRALSEWVQVNCEKYGIDQDCSILMGDQYTLAMLSFDASAAKLPCIAYISQVKDPQKAKKLLESLFKAAIDLTPKNIKITVDQDEYKDTVVYSLQGPGMIPGLGISYTFINNVLIMTTSKPALFRLLDEREFNEHRLAAEPIYKEVLSQLPDKRQLTLFFNISSITNTVSQVLELIKLIQGGTGEQNQQIVKTLQAIPFLTSLKGYGAGYYPGEGDKPSKAIGYTLSDKVAPDSPFAFLDRAPIAFNLESYMPRQTGSFYVGNIFNLNDIWQLFKVLVPMFPGGDKILEQVVNSQEFTGFSIEKDILSWVGEEWCVIRPVMDMESVIPMNRLVYIAKVTNRQAALDGLGKIIEGIKQKLPAGVSFENEDFKGAGITALRIPLPLPVVPSWCITQDDYLIIASDTTLLREMLEVKAGTISGITRNTYYRQLQSTLQTKANSFSFQDIYNEFMTAREAIRRVVSVLEQAGEKMSPDQKLPLIILDKTSYLLRCYQILKGSTKVSVSTEKGEITTQYLLMQDLQVVPTIQPLTLSKAVLAPKGESAKFVESLASQVEPKEAIRYYQILVDFFPNQSDYLAKLAGLCKQAGNGDKAIEIYNKSLESAPSTALFIEREKVRNAASLDEIAKYIKEAAGRSKEIKEDYAFFGLALAKRDAGQTELAAKLFDHTVNNYPNFTLIAGASQEAALSRKETPASTLSIVKVDSAPVINGVKDEPVWDKAQALPLVSAKVSTSTDVWEISARAAHDNQKLYILLQGKDPVAKDQIHRESFDIKINPSRDYSQIIDFRSILKQEGNEKEGFEINQTRKIESKTLHVPVLVLDAAQNAFDTKQNWDFNKNYADGVWTAEIAIPLEAIQQNQAKDSKIWLMNISRSLEIKGGNKQLFTLNPQKGDDEMTAFSLSMLME